MIPEQPELPRGHYKIRNTPDLFNLSYYEINENNNYTINNFDVNVSIAPGYGGSSLSTSPCTSHNNPYTITGEYEICPAGTKSVNHLCEPCPAGTNSNEGSSTCTSR